MAFSEKPEILKVLAAQAAKIARTSASLRTRARRTSALLTKRDRKGLFRCAGGWQDATWHTPGDVFARLEALDLVSSERVERKLCALTELGSEVRQVFKWECDATGKPKVQP